MKTTGLLLGCLALLGIGVGCASPPADETSDDQARVTGTAATTPLPDDYEARSAKDKEELLWSKRVLPSTYTELPPFGKLDPAGLLVLDFGVSLSRSSDELPAGRKKLVHERGSVVRVEYIADATSPYSGLWKGASGIARLSVAAPPDATQFTPAIAIKMFIDGMPSQNLQVMFSSDGQGTNRDFFANTFTNILPQPGTTATKLAGKLFSRANPFPNAVSLDGFSKTDRHGVSVERLSAPHQAFFVPSEAVKAVRRTSSAAVDFRDDLAKIPAGTVLYEVSATGFQTPKPVHIGKLVTRSEVVAARYGDEQLFFKHEGAKSGE